MTKIAYDLGFSGSSQFLRAFQSRFGMTPSEARQQGSALVFTDRHIVSVQAHFAKFARPR
ncbi:helix-turn-helix domain-containing protein [Nordella sp. HKS 07]|uniref:helix-turn-helix domain-containing protein n=1 Tax=Nordella sp. HKS 07 TaxID=2712222 RepID=UPI00352EF6C7